MKKTLQNMKDATLITALVAYIVGGLFAVIPIGAWVQCRYGGVASIVAVVIYLIVWFWCIAFLMVR